MDEDEDTYGFGSFSELFDAAPARAAKRLDIGTLRRFFMSERLLARFQAQQRRAQPQCKLFQHVAAKFDSVALEGGLGSLGVVALEGGGVVWLQRERSDSDALERRAKELQDITNRRDEDHANGAKSAAALFVAVKEVEAVHPTTVQNTVQGVELKLRDGARLELIFMPGPYSGSTHRDEFLEALKKTMDGASEKEDGGDAAADLATVDSKNAAHKEVDGPDAAEKEVFRQLVRRYTKLDAMSDEGLEIAQQVHAGTGYHVGPTTKQPPKFAADSAYRKKTVAQLSEFLQRMNGEWSEAEAHREQHTKAKHSRNDDLFEYTDTVTGAQIPTRAYEQRYLEYVKAHEVDPVLHLCPVQNKSAEPAPVASAEADESATRVFTATLGLDIGSSCIVDKDLFVLGAAHAPSDTAVFGAEDAEFRAKVDRAQAKLWASWGSALATLTRSLRDEAERQPDHAKQVAPGVAGHSTRKRARERRRSLVLPNADDLESTIEANVPGRSQAEGAATHGGDERQPRTKRSRPVAQKSDTAHKSQRKSRRQSIIGTVDLASAAEKKTSDKRRTPRHKSPRVRHPANGYARETSALEMVGDEDSDLCKLCYSERALVHMKPCGHVVCTSCWARLSPPSGKDGSSSRRVCPWDREDVTKRQH